MNTFSSPKKTQSANIVSSLVLSCFFVLGFIGWQIFGDQIPAFSISSLYAMQTDERQTFREGASSLVTSSEVGTTWRRTKDGWQDSTTWSNGDQFVPRKSFQSIHPFVWAAIVLLSVIAAMIWASNEWEISRLFEEETTTDT
ncbi:MAG: hypothetical protein AB8B55_21210 [Mariniblastus sp.]